MPITNPVSMNYAVFIFAHNESAVIADTVRSVLDALQNRGDLWVIADHCDDDTAQIARNAGASVFERSAQKKRGKGAALSWVMQHYHRDLAAVDYVVILDADSRIGDDYFCNLDLEISKHQPLCVGQCFLKPVDYESSRLTTLIALSELIEQRVFDGIRAGFGLSVRLRGTGMVFNPDYLAQISPRIGTEVEDIALSLLSAEQKQIVRSLTSAVVYDPKPIERVSASRQRARWFRGQWAALRKYWRIVLRLILRGPVGWAVINSLFLKPRWLKFVLVVLSGIGFLLFNHLLLAFIFLSIVGVESIFVLAGTLLLPERRFFLRSFLSIPVFILMWIKGIILSCKEHPWWSVRGESPKDGNHHSSTRF